MELEHAQGSPLTGYRGDSTLLVDAHPLYCQLGWAQSEEQSFALHLFSAAQQPLASLPAFVGLVSAGAAAWV